MKVSKTYILPILVTLLSVIAGMVWTNVWSYGLGCLLISFSWLVVTLKKHSELQKKQSIIERVNLLKDFSMELQVLINRELGLVQDDVVRVRTIVSDSIGLLQENVTYIGSQSKDQRQLLQSLIKDFSAQSHSSSINNTMQLIENLQILTLQLRQITKSSQNLGLIAKEASMLADKSLSSAAKITGLSTVISHMADKEFKNTTNTIAFGEEIERLTDKLDKSILILKSVSADQQPLAKLSNNYKDFPLMVDEHVRAIEHSQQEIIRALQFEDIVSQISGRVFDHIGDIRNAVTLLAHLCDSELSDTFASDIANMKTQLEQLKKKLEKDSAKAVVAQQNMDEGDIELF